MRVSSHTIRNIKRLSLKSKPLQYESTIQESLLNRNDIDRQRRRRKYKLNANTNRKKLPSLFDYADDLEDYASDEVYLYSFSSVKHLHLDGNNKAVLNVIS